MKSGMLRVWFAIWAIVLAAISVPAFCQEKPADAPLTSVTEQSRLPGNADTPQAASRGKYIIVPVSELASPTSGINKASEDKSTDLAATLVAIIAAVAWPFAAVLLLRRLLESPQIEVLINGLSRRAASISIAGLEIKLSDGAEATIEDLKKLIGKVPETHQAWVHNTHLVDQLRNVITSLKTYLCAKQHGYTQAIATNKEFERLRFTLHVPDIVFTHSLRQLVNYLGCDRTGGGRLFSARRGIIGLAWRLEHSCYQVQDFTETELVELWGMTRTEASDTSSGKTLLWAFVLKNEKDIPVGLLYVDGAVPNFFDEARIGPIEPRIVFDNIDNQVRAFAKKTGLIESLADLEKARVKVTQIDIYDIF